MSDIINKAFLAGLGAISITREKMESVVEDLVKQGEISKGEKTTIVDNLQKEVEKRRDEFKEFIQKEVSTVLKKINVPTRQEMDALKDEIKKLSKDS